MVLKEIAEQENEVAFYDIDKVFDTNEVVITVIRKRAIQCSWDDIQVTLNRTMWPAGPEVDSSHHVSGLSCTLVPHIK